MPLAFCRLLEKMLTHAAKKDEDTQRPTLSAREAGD
jgi:hypothetical protein